MNNQLFTVENHFNRVGCSKSKSKFKVLLENLILIFLRIFIFQLSEVYKVTVTGLTVLHFYLILQAFFSRSWHCKENVMLIFLQIQLAVISCLLYKILLTELTVLQFNLTIQAFCSMLWNNMFLKRII